VVFRRAATTAARRAMGGFVRVRPGTRLPSTSNRKQIRRRSWMRKLQIGAGSLAATAALLVAGPVAATPKHSTKPSSAGKALGGGVTIGVHAHSNPGLLFPTERLTYDFQQGETFAYSSRQCAAPAPFNEVGLDFRPDYPGIDAATGVAAVRHLAEGTVTSVRHNGDRGTIEGTITSVVCVTQNGQRVESGDALVMDYTARFRRTTDNEMQLTGRFTFSPSESTGTFEDVTGRGSLRAQLTCLSHERDPSMPSCEDLGYFTDFVGLRGDTSAPPGETTPGIIGHFRDRTA
jgi:hypothetical protein